MGSHTRDVNPDKKINELLNNSSAFLDTDKGLPERIKADMIKKGKGFLSGSYESGTADLKQALQGSGSGVTVDALIAGKTKLLSQKNQGLLDLNSNVQNADYEAVEANKNRLMDEYKTKLSAWGAQQQFGSEDEARNSGFKIGDLIGSVAGVGGQLGGGALARKGAK